MLEALRHFFHSPLLCLLLLAVIQGFVTHSSIMAGEAGGSEAATMALAAKPGPSRSKALRQLGEGKPTDVDGVIAVLVDAVLANDVMCQITAGQSLRSLAWPRKSPAVADALNPHGERLLTAAVSSMSELTNPALEALSFLSKPSSTFVPRLMKMLAPGAKFRRYTTTTLSRCRPLTPELRRVVLAETASGPLVQQDLAFALGEWSAEELSGDDVDQALARLMESAMGNVPQIVMSVAKQRTQLCTHLLARLRELIVYPATPDQLLAATLKSFAELAGDQEAQALILKLLQHDPHLDPDRFIISLSLLDSRRPIPEPMVTRLLALANDQTLDWWLRRGVVRLLAERTPDVPLAGDLAALAVEPYWVRDVYGAIYSPKNGPPIEQRLAEAKSDEERAVWSLVQPLAKAVAMHAQDPDINQRGGAWAVTFLTTWATEHPDAAWQPHVVYLTLKGFCNNYAATDSERAQAITYVATCIQRGVFVAPDLRTKRFPDGGAAELRRACVEALTAAVLVRGSHKDEDQKRDRRAEASLEVVRSLREFKAPELLLRHAERVLAGRVRNHVREYRLDPEIYRKPLADCGFSLLPIDALLEEAARPYRSAQR